MTLLAGGTGTNKIERRKSGGTAASAGAGASSTKATGNDTSSVSQVEETSSGTNKGNKAPPLKERYLWCLHMLKQHHLVDEAGHVGVQTCWPFNKAVDPVQYPLYPTVS